MVSPSAQAGVSTCCLISLTSIVTASSSHLSDRLSHIAHRISSLGYAMRQRTGPIHLSGDLEKDVSNETVVPEDDSKHRKSKPDRRMLYAVLATLAVMSYLSVRGPFFPLPRPSHPANGDMIKQGLERCEEVRSMPPDTSNFAKDRTMSDRYEPGTRPVLLNNGTLWTGDDNGEQVICGGSILLKNGIIWKIGKHKDVIKEMEAEGLRDDEIETVELSGKWVTPGIVDTHRCVLPCSCAFSTCHDVNGTNILSSIHPPRNPINGFSVTPWTTVHQN